MAQQLADKVSTTQSLNFVVSAVGFSALARIRLGRGTLPASAQSYGVGIHRSSCPLFIRTRRYLASTAAPVEPTFGAISRILVRSKLSLLHLNVRRVDLLIVMRRLRSCSTSDPASLRSITVVRKIQTLHRRDCLGMTYGFVRPLALALAAAVMLPVTAIAGTTSHVGPTNSTFRLTRVPARVGVTTESSSTAGTCLTVSVAPLNLGLIVPGRAGTTIKASTTIYVNCKRGTRFALYLNEGSSSTSNSLDGRRSFPHTAGSLEYDLFQDSARTTLWGNGTNGAGINGVGDGNLQRFPVYALFYVRPTAPIGPHSDSLTVTLSIFS